MATVPRLSVARRRSAPRAAAWLRAKPAGQAVLALTVAVTCVIALLAPAPVALAMPANPSPASVAQLDAYQVSLSVGTGAQYELLKGGKLDLPVTVSVAGALGLASASVFVKYDPVNLRPVGCVRPPDGLGGYCNISWDPAAGLVRFNILAPAGVLGDNLPVFILTFEPTPTAKTPTTTSITPLLDSIADVSGNYMTSLMQGSPVRIVSAKPTGPQVTVGSSTSQISVVRGTPVTVPVVVTGVTGLGSATFSLSFDPAVVRAIDCRPVQHLDASGLCALHSDHVSANLLSEKGLSETVSAFEVTFTTAPSATWPDESPLSLVLGAFANTNGVPITVSINDNSIKVSKQAGATAPVLRLTPASQSLVNDQRVDVQIYLDDGAALTSGSWGIRYEPTVVEAESCVPHANGGCNAIGEPGLVRMTVLRDPGDAPFPAHMATITFRRHPEAAATQRADLVLEVTNFADAADEQLAYETLAASITIVDTLGQPPAVAINLVATPPYPPWPLPMGSSIDFPIHFEIDPGRPIVNLSGSIHYDPLVLRPTCCIRYDGGNGPSGNCNSETQQPDGLIKFNLLADSEQGFSGSFTPFVFRMEAASTSKVGDKSPLHFTIEAIAGPNGVPRTWSAQDEVVDVKTPIDAARVLVGPPAATTTSYSVVMGSTETVPIWVSGVSHLGAGTVEVRYDSAVARATGCRLRSDLTPALDGGFCAPLPGVVRAVFVASVGIEGEAEIFDVEFSQAPNVIGGERTPLEVVVDNFVDTAEVPIPTAIRNGDLHISCSAPPVTDLRIGRDGANVALTWSHVGAATTGYGVWRADVNPYFSFGDTYSTSIATVPAPAGPPGSQVLYTDASGAGSTWVDNLNHFYMVRTLCRAGGASDLSNRVGKFTYQLVPGASAPLGTGPIAP